MKKLKEKRLAQVLLTALAASSLHLASSPPPTAHADAYSTRTTSSNNKLTVKSDTNNSGYFTYGDDTTQKYPFFNATNYIYSTGIIGGLYDIDTSTFGTSWLIGGFASSEGGAANNNSVYFDFNDLTTPYNGHIYGGYAVNSEAKSNQVIINNGYIQNEVYGGVAYGSGSNAEENSVTVSGGLIDNWIYAGRTIHNDSILASGDVKNNKIVITGGSFGTGVTDTVSYSYNGDMAVVGGWTDYGNVEGNSIEISGGQFATSAVLQGAFSQVGNVTNNTISLGSNVQLNRVTGAAHNRGSNINVPGTAYSVKNNTVTIKDSAVVYNEVQAGEALDSTQSGEVSNNTVNIEGGTVHGVVIGGMLHTAGTLSGNKVNISGGTIGGSENSREVYGGLANEGTVTQNTVSITGGRTIKVPVYGGRATSSGNVSSNSVSITSNSTIGGDVYGGHSDTGESKNNEVVMSNGNVDGSIYVGYSNANEVSGNKITLSGGTVAGEVFGGHAAGIYDSVTGSFSSGGYAIDNKVLLSGTNVSNGVFAGLAWIGSASNNTLEASGGSASYLIGGKSEQGNATSNFVSVAGGTINGTNHISRFGSNTETTIAIAIAGGYSELKDASNNSVSITGGTINGNIYGGYAEGYGNTVGAASNNTVNISLPSDSSFGAIDIFGGYSKGGAVKDNVINLYSSAGNASLYGYNNEAGTDRSGNTLNVYGSGNQGFDAANIANFNSINFYIDSTTTQPGNPNDYYMLKLTAQTTDLNNATIGVGVKGDNNDLPSWLQSGGEIGLLLNEGSFTNFNSEGKLYEGISNDYKLTLSLGTYNSMATISAAFASNATSSSSNNSLIFNGSNFDITLGGGTTTTKAIPSDFTAVIGGLADSYDWQVYGGRSSLDSDEASKNKVTVTGGTINGDVRGGHSKKGNATSNSVVITGGSMVNVYGGDISSNAESAAEVSNNQVSIGGSAAISGYVIGGFTPGTGGNVSYNSVTVSSGTISDKVVGGQTGDGTSSDAGDVLHNSVLVTGGSMKQAIGGAAWGNNSSGKADNNSVTVQGGTFSENEAVIGGSAGSGGASNNNVNISLATGSEGVLNGKAIRGGSASGAADSNTVAVESAMTATDGLSLIGGQGASAANNVVNIQGVNANSSSSSGHISIVGGQATSGEAVGNAVSITASSLHTAVNNQNTEEVVVNGALASGGNASLNSVYIGSGANIGGAVHGASENSTFDVVNNSVSIVGGSVGGANGGLSYNGNASLNSVYVGDGASVRGFVAGGRQSAAAASRVRR